MRLLILALVLAMTPLVAMESSLRSDGTLLVDGEAWFPFGYYHVSWIEERYGAPRLGDLRSIADSGANAMQPTLTTDNPGLEEFCSEASIRGVGLFAEIYWPGRNTQIPLLEGYDAIVAWNIGDDVNYPGNDPNITPAELLVRHQEVKALDPGRLTFAAGIVEGYDITAYVGTVDIFGVESYPIGNYGDVEALSVHHGLCATAREVFAGSATTWILLPQTFAWSGQRYPTNIEIRNMIYAGLIEGAKGMIGYTFYHEKDKVLPSENPTLWAELTTVTREVRELEPVLIDAPLTRPATQAPSAKCGLWTTTDGAYVAVINTSTTVTSTVSIALPAGLGAVAAPLFADRPSGLSISGGNLVGAIAPRATHVYRIAKASTAAPMITAQPISLAVVEPATATFTLSASGGSTYQWQSAAPGFSTFSPISGAASASYTTGATSTAMDGTRYRCVVTNSAGSATSSSATLTVTAGSTAPTSPLPNPTAGGGGKGGCGLGSGMAIGLAALALTRLRTGRERR